MTFFNFHVHTNFDLHVELHTLQPFQTFQNKIIVEYIWLLAI